MALTWASVLGWRLRRHWLGDELAGSVQEVVDRLVAVPAWSGDATTAIRLRLAEPADEGDDVARAVDEGRVVSTYSFRGATHLMTPASAAVHLSLRCAGRQWERASWRTHYRLEPQDWPRLRSMVRDALRDGPLTQPELAAAVAQDPAYAHLRSAFENPSHTFLKPFGWQGDLCLGSADGRVTFRLLESIPGWSGLVDLDEAGPRAIRAYLSAYGPATPDRIEYWLGQGLSAGRRRLAGWLDGMRDELVPLTVERTEVLCLAEHVDEVRAQPESDLVVLLPGSDQWVLGAGTSDPHVVPPAHRQAATRGRNLVLVGGTARGTWTSADGAVSVEWFDGETRVHGSPLADATARLAGALGRDLTPPAG